MSLICETIGSEDEVSQGITKSTHMNKNSFEEEELDYEEEDVDELKPNNSNPIPEDEGELCEEEEDNEGEVKEIKIKKETKLDKDEGELDDEEELEEGEVKEDEDENKVDSTSDIDSNNLGQTKNRQLEHETQNLPRRDLQRQNKNYNNSYWPPNQNYGNSRYTVKPRTDRYNNPRPRDYVQPMPTIQTSESAWERGLKQARELITKASKRKEEEVDFENKRFNLTMKTDIPPKPLNREKTPERPEKRRRHSSQQNDSSEDEVERRHRLAYDAAPWNNQNASYPQSNSRNRPMTYSSNRSAETYRDPWRRSKSPKPVQSRRRPDVDTRYGDVHKRETLNSDLRKSNSMSSLSSICSNSSINSRSDKSSGRKLPYSRPNLESRSRFSRDKDLSPHQNNRDYIKSRMDRIPKKNNASPNYQTKNRVSETKSFDSWSESLSDSDSSSFYSNSDSESDDTGDNNANGQKSSTNKVSKRSNLSSNERHSKSRLQKQENHHNATHKKIKTTYDAKGMSSKPSKLESEKAVKKAPIKMTFMKKQNVVKKDRLIDEQLNGDHSELEDIDLEGSNHSRTSRISSNKSLDRNSDVSDEENMRSRDSSNSGSSKMNRREELLLKLKAVEEAIERKLNSKKDI